MPQTQVAVLVAGGVGVHADEEVGVRVNRAAHALAQARVLVAGRTTTASRRGFPLAVSASTAGG